MGEMTVDAENILHLERCWPGCDECLALLEFYSACSECGEWGHKSALVYDPSTGKHFCAAHAPRAGSSSGETA